VFDLELFLEIAMKYTSRILLATVVAVFVSFPLIVKSQNAVTILAGPELTRVVPPGFYFQGQSAPTQMRNSAAVRFAEKRYVVVGMVDTTGYAADVRARYEGFFITDSSIRINGSDLKTGAYGFGFSDDGKLHILDLADEEVLSTSTTKDSTVRRPRPLMMMKSAQPGHAFTTSTLPARTHCARAEPLR
jgi:hypothetical protein